MANYNAVLRTLYTSVYIDLGKKHIRRPFSLVFLPFSFRSLGEFASPDGLHTNKDISSMRVREIMVHWPLSAQ